MGHIRSWGASVQLSYSCFTRCAQAQQHEHRTSGPSWSGPGPEGLTFIWNIWNSKALALKRGENHRFRTRKMILSQLDDLHQLHLHRLQHRILYISSISFSSSISYLHHGHPVHHQFTLHLHHVHHQHHPQQLFHRHQHQLHQHHTPCSPQINPKC